jgi:hypothetical protein
MKLTKAEIRWALPWPQPESIYDLDGPDTDKPVEFNVNGARIRVVRTGDVAVDTFRDRFKVECLTCDMVLHASTTSATIRVEDHILMAHLEKI